MTAALAPSSSPTLVAPTDGIPNANAFIETLTGNEKRPRALKKLFDRLARIDSQGDLFEREEAMVGLADWVRRGGEVPSMPGAEALERPQTQRLRVLVEALAQFPFFRARVSASMQKLLRELTANEFFGKLGIPGDRGLMSETIDRLSKRFMPQPIDEQDITQLLVRFFPRRSDTKWIAGLPPELVMRFVRLVKNPALPDQPPSDGGRISFLPGGGRGHLPLGAMPSLHEIPTSSLPPSSLTFSVFAPLRASILEAILLLALRVSAAGLSDEIRARSNQKTLSASPFFRLPRSIDQLLATPRHDQSEITVWATECSALVDECRKAMATVFIKLEETGVSVDVVYRLELIEKSLQRIEALVEILLATDPLEHTLKATLLLVTLLDERRRHVSLTDIGRSTTRLLARKIIERAGTTGEHYITSTPGEFVKMFFSAGGGGILTAGTCALKFIVSWLHRPGLQDGLLASCNYAGSFMLMQLLGFTLATKQPSMTAAALAGALKEDNPDHEVVVTTIARLFRSQLAAAAGNVSMVIPASIGVDMAWMRTHNNQHMLTPEYAHKTLKSLSATQSGTIGFAAITGVILWASSLGAGWLENWAVYRRVPEAIAEHRLRRILGQRFMSWVSRVFARNIAGVGGNFTIGFLLGMVPVLASFAGLPIEVRHVTLSTGSIAFAVQALGPETLYTQELKEAAVGVACILTLNLLVSFALAFGVALRAREVKMSEALRLFGAVIVGFFKSPIRFFLPIEKKGTKPAAAH